MVEGGFTARASAEVAPRNQGSAPGVNPRPKARGLAGAVGLTCVSGALYGVAFPPIGAEIVAWFAIAPFLLALDGARARRALALGALWGIVASYAVGDWMPRAVVRYWQQPVAVGIAAFLVYSFVVASLQYAVFAVAYPRLRRLAAPLAPLGVAAGWVAVELARVKPITGNPWGIVGFSQIDAVPLVQIADVTGVYGVSFVVAAVNAGLAELWRARRAGSRERAAAAVGLGTALLLVGGLAGYGAWRLDAEAGAAPAVPVAVVQANLDLGSQWKPEFYGANLEAYLRSTDETLRARPARLVVWPENALSFFLEEEALYRAAIARVLAPSRAELLVGGPRLATALGKPEPRYLNAAFVVDSRGSIQAIYEKQHLVPFAEFFPLPELDFLRREFGRVREFSPGTAKAPLPTAAGPAGILICNEVLFPETVRERVDAGAEVLVNLTNDSWVGERRYAEIAFGIARMRAIEFRRPLVRASTSGPSAVIDPFGRPGAIAAAETAATIEGDLRPASERTPYDRFGDWFAWSCVAVALALVFRPVRSPTPAAPVHP